MDGDLIRQLKEGNREAAEVFYDTHAPQVHRYLHIFTQSRRVATRLTPDIFTQVLKVIQDEATSVSPVALLYRAAGREIRQVRERYPVPSDPRIQALARLTWEQQQALVLRFVMGLSLRQVTEVLGDSDATVPQLQHRGLVALRRVLDESL